MSKPDFRLWAVAILVSIISALVSIAVAEMIVQVVSMYT